MTYRDDEPPTRALSALELQACLEAEREPEVLTSAITRVAIQRLEQGDLRGFTERAEAQLTRTAITVVASAPAGCEETKLALPRRLREQVRAVPEATARPVRSRIRFFALATPLLAVALTGFFTLRTQRVSHTTRHVSAQVTKALTPRAAIQPAIAPQAQHKSAEHALASPRRAVDLLLSGRTRDALDAYRALALEQPAQPAYALVVELLERDLKACRSGEGEGACR